VFPLDFQVVFCVFSRALALLAIKIVAIETYLSVLWHIVLQASTACNYRVFNTFLCFCAKMSEYTAR